eukprot:6190296-Pleurochrysis_carterae.AAC.4
MWVEGGGAGSQLRAPQWRDFWAAAAACAGLRSPRCACASRPRPRPRRCCRWRWRAAAAAVASTRAFDRESDSAGRSYPAEQGRRIPQRSTRPPSRGWACLR